MIRNGDLVRFTPDEIDQFRSVGLDATGVRTIEDFGAAVAKWCDLLEEVRPDVLEKFARAMAEARGVKHPPSSRFTTTTAERGKTSLEKGGLRSAIPKRTAPVKALAA